MAEWLYEAGIGENRAALVRNGELVAARIEADDDGPLPGAVLAARLGPVVIPGRTARAMTDQGEVMLTCLPKGISEGGALRVEITRQAIHEPGNPKLAQAVPSDAGLPSPAPTLLDRLIATGLPVRHCQPHEQDWLEQAGWSECQEEARTGQVAFPGGILRMSLTPAMTIFDIDGGLPPLELSRRAALAIGKAIMRHDLAGSIGMDFPTLANKAERLAVADVLDDAMEGPYERTAINGFGFLQLIRPRRYPSIPERLRADPAGSRARTLLRRISRIPPPVPRTWHVDSLSWHWLDQHPELVERLRRQTGAPIDFHLNPAGQ